MRSIPTAAATALAAFAIALPAAAETGIFVTKQSPHDVETTLDRIAERVEANEGKVFYRIDHQEAAAEYDREMPPTQVLIFGNPANGTGLMKKHPEISVDLPLKVGAYETEDGRVMLIYRDPRRIWADHGLGEGGEGIARMLDGLTDRAIAED